VDKRKQAFAPVFLPYFLLKLTENKTDNPIWIFGLVIFGFLPDN